MVTLLTRKLEFPSASSANGDGLVAVGGDLSVDRLLLAYRSGIFPWPIFDDDLMTWFSPNPRAVLELDAIHISRSLGKRLRQNTFEVSFNTDFPAVIAACAESMPNRRSTWITKELKRAYTELHETGYVHSVECRKDGQLVGGLYGVSIGAFFAGESMFARVRDASKVALVHLVQRLRERCFELMDIQQATPHMMRMGAIEIPRRRYLERLHHALDQPVTFID